MSDALRCEASNVVKAHADIADIADIADMADIADIADIADMADADGTARVTRSQFGGIGGKACKDPTLRRHVGLGALFGRFLEFGTGLGLIPRLSGPAKRRRKI